jgi:hypothetical protein
MNNRFLGILLLGGAGYLFYKYYYLPMYGEKIEESTNKFEEEIDGRTTFYGDSKDEYVRGFIFPSKITDIKFDEIDVITKPKESVFNLEPRTMFRVKLNKDKNRVVYASKHNEKQSEYISEYEKVKDKLVMLKDYTK